MSWPWPWCGVGVGEGWTGMGGDGRGAGRKEAAFCRRRREGDAMFGGKNMIGNDAPAKKDGYLESIV